MRPLLLCALLAACGTAAPAIVPVTTTPPVPRGPACLTRLWSRKIMTAIFTISPDGREVVYTGDEKPTLTVAAIETGRIRGRWAPTDEARSIGFLMWRGQHILALHDEIWFTLVDARKLAHICTPHLKEMIFLAKAVADRNVLAVTFGGEPSILDPASCGFAARTQTPAEKLMTTWPHGEEGDAVASLDGRYLYHGADTGEIEAWDTRTGQRVVPPPKGVTFAPDQVLRLAKDDGRIELLDPATGQRRLRDPVEADAQLSSRGTHLVQHSCRDDCELTVYAVGACP